MYQIKQLIEFRTGATRWIIEGPHGYFAGYDFMGSINWVKFPVDASRMDRKEAQTILNDLNEMEG